MSINSEICCLIISFEHYEDILTRNKWQEVNIKKMLRCKLYRVDRSDNWVPERRVFPAVDDDVDRAFDDQV